MIKFGSSKFIFGIRNLELFVRNTKLTTTNQRSDFYLNPLRLLGKLRDQLAAHIYEHSLP